MFEMLPYGANIIVNSISSSIVRKFPVNRPDYITSAIEISEITYSYIEYNGNIVEILTNLELINWDKTNKIFTVSNRNIFNTTEKPYIKLCCNNVKIPISFIDHDGSGNKFVRGVYSDNNPNIIQIYGEEPVDIIDYLDWVQIASYYIISWNKVEKQQIFQFRDTRSSSDYYACDIFYNYLDNNNKIQQDSFNIWSYGNKNFEDEGYITIPKLNGTSSSVRVGNTTERIKLTKKFINYFVVGIQIKLNNGYSTYKSNTLNYIKNNNFIYDNIGRGFNSINGVYYLKNNKGIPVQTKNLNIKWNTDFFYTTITTSLQSSIYYISPSTSRIYYKWELEGNCDSFCSCYGKCRGYDPCPSDDYCSNDEGCWEDDCFDNDPEDCPSYGSCMSYGGDEDRVHAQGIYSNGIYMGSTGEVVSDGSSIFIPEGWYKVLGYRGNTPIIKVNGKSVYLYYYD